MAVKIGDLAKTVMKELDDYGVAVGLEVEKVSKEVAEDTAKILNTTPEYLLGNSGMLVLAAQEQGGAKAAREIDELVSEVSGMFAGGSLSEDALDGAMQALTRAYWIAKEKNKKYTPKKYRKEQTEE